MSWLSQAIQGRIWFWIDSSELGTSSHKRMISSVPFGGSISSGRLSFVVVAIVGVVIVVTIFGVVVVVDDVSLIFKLSLMIIEVLVGPVFLLGLLALAIDAACAFRAEEMPSLISCRMAAKVMAGVSDVDVLLGRFLSIKDKRNKKDYPKLKKRM
ncbi:hypothetical protein Tco_1184228 [Tanacetum coccineum]